MQRYSILAADYFFYAHAIVPFYGDDFASCDDGAMHHNFDMVAHLPVQFDNGTSH